MSDNTTEEMHPLSVNVFC